MYEKINRIAGPFRPRGGRALSGRVASDETDLNISPAPNLTIGDGFQGAMKNETRPWALSRADNNRADYLAAESPRGRTVRRQFDELAGHLVGRDIRPALDELYRPGDIVETKTDGLTGAAIRSGKVNSAIRDALNRGGYGR